MDLLATIEKAKQFLRLLEADASAVKSREDHEVFLLNHERRTREFQSAVATLDQLATRASEALILSGRTAGVSERETWEQVQGQ